MTVPNDTTAPTVAITSPVNGIAVAGVVAVLAEASDDSGVAGVQFQLDGAPLGAEDTAAPYELLWNAADSANGAHTLTAVARDAAGNQATAASVVVTVANDMTAPTVALTSPAARQRKRHRDDRGDRHGQHRRRERQFLVNGVSLGAADTPAPYRAAVDHADRGQRRPHADGGGTRRGRQLGASASLS